MGTLILDSRRPGNSSTTGAGFVGAARGLPPAGDIPKCRGLIILSRHPRGGSIGVRFGRGVIAGDVRSIPSFPAQLPVSAGPSYARCNKQDKSGNKGARPAPSQPSIRDLEGLEPLSFFARVLHHMHDRSAAGQLHRSVPDRSLRLDAAPGLHVEIPGWHSLWGVRRSPGNPLANNLDIH